MDVTAATPREIDEALAALHMDAAKALQSIAHAKADLHYALGERQVRTGYGRKATWPTTDDEAEAKCREMADPAEYDFIPAGKAARAIARLDAALATRDAALGAMVPLDAEYDRRPWTRFFLVTSSDGHIHRDMNCSTCRPTTAYGWLPTLSGKDEAAAVAEQGTRLCSVCYPSAPVEWTVGLPSKATHCAGGAPASTWTAGMKRYGKCPTCDEGQIVTAAGVVRKHAAAK